MAYTVGIDTGGTFTDVVVIDDRGQIYFDKAFSTPQDPQQGVLAALENCVRLLEKDIRSVLSDTHRFAHGTTVATNALIQRRGARVGLIMTKGFEDTIIITRGPMGKNLGIPPGEAMDFIHNERPEPLVPRALIRGIRERIAVDGKIIAPLRDAEVAQVARDLLAQGAESLAVCLLWSFRNDRHEKRVGEIIRAIDGVLPVNLSSEISPLLGEFERAMTTVVNAFIGPVVARYINNLAAGLARHGLKKPVQLMTCAGGLTLPERIEREAVTVVNSGPVGGLVAARHLGKLLGYENVITADMGGTSFDVGVIHKGEFEYEKTPFLSKGVPVQTPALRVVTIGAGGGSIAWSDGRRLMVGPQSAGADPGPACYDLGGAEPTVTDALVVLGILDADYFFGGRKKLSRSRAEEAIWQRVARPLGLDLVEAAAGIYEIVTAKMSDLIRKMTVESGYDPREFALFAYGGAGPAHCAVYGEALGIREVIVPSTAAVFSALGCALSDIKFNYAKSEPAVLDDRSETIQLCNAVFRELEQRALRDMEECAFRREEVLLLRRLDLRYEGQMNEITIPWEGKELDPHSVKDIRHLFESAYETRFGRGITRTESPIEVISFRVEALRATDKPVMPRAGDGDPDPHRAAKGHREVYLSHTTAKAGVYEYEQLFPGNILPGPAIIERRDTTILVPARHQAKVDGYSNVKIYPGEMA